MAAGEECDEFESWEEMEDSGVLDKKIEKLKAAAAMSTSIQKGLRSGISSSGKSDTVVILAEDGRTRYVPPEPTVKILKRPSVVNNTHNAGGDGFIVNGDNSGKPKQPIKTLQQREMEYAEARLRILGEAQSPDERPALLERICRIQNKVESVPEPFEQNITTPVTITANLSTSLSSITDNTSFPSTPSQSGGVITTTIMTLSSPPMSHQQQKIISYNPSNGGGNCVGMNNVGMNNAIIGLYQHHHNNNISNHYNHPIAIAGGSNNYSLINHHQHNNYIYHQNHYHHHLNNMISQSAIQSSNSSNNIITGTNNMATSPTTINMTSTTNNIISAPISHNMVIRQPRGPDGTKGFYVRTLR